MTKPGERPKTGRGLERICPSCGTVFRVWPHKARAVNFCSRPCRVKSDFWAQVERGAPELCWPWSGPKMPSGYGTTRWDLGRGRRPYGAHQVALFLATGVATGNGLVARHTCDNPPCCNPKHLIVGTPAENTADAIERGRLRPRLGERHPRTELTTDTVRAIKAAAAAGERQCEIARRLGVRQNVVWKIVSGKTWAHVGAAA